MTEIILVVDDEKEIRDLLEAFLEADGYETCTASSGIEGLRQLYERQPDAVISDVVMSGMDGYEFCHLAREMCGVPIMMVTGVKGQDNVLRFSPDIDDYMTKPFTMDEFLTRVAALLKRRRSSSGDDQETRLVRL